MAHYAQLGVDNIVTRVWTVNNIDCMTVGGIEKDEIVHIILIREFMF